MTMTLRSIVFPEPFQPRLLIAYETVTPKKVGEIACFRLLLYRLLNIRINRAKIATIATIMPADTGMKYKSAADAGVGVGGGVASGASSTFIAVSADDPQ